MFGFALRPSTDETFTIEPPPACFRAGTTARMPRKGPIWFTRTCRSKSARLVSSSGFMASTPALFTSTSRRPKLPSVRSTARAQSASSPTSSFTNAAASPSAFASPSPSLSSTSPIITRAPSATNRRTTCSPVPRAPPVTSATFPARRPISKQDGVERQRARAGEQEHEADHGEVDGVLGPGRIVRDQVAGALVSEHPGHAHREDQQQASGPCEQAEREKAAAAELRDHRHARLHPGIRHAEAAQPVREPRHVPRADEAELSERVDHEADADRDAAYEHRQIDEPGRAAGQERAPVHSARTSEGPLSYQTGCRMAPKLEVPAWRVLSAPSSWPWRSATPPWPLRPRSRTGCRTRPRCPAAGRGRST